MMKLKIAALAIGALSLASAISFAAAPVSITIKNNTGNTLTPTCDGTTSSIPIPAGTYPPFVGIPWADLSGLGISIQHPAHGYDCFFGAKGDTQSEMLHVLITPVSPVTGSITYVSKGQPGQRYKLNITDTTTGKGYTYGTVTPDSLFIEIDKA